MKYYDETAQTTEAFNVGLEAGKEEERKKFINSMDVMIAEINKLRNENELLELTLRRYEQEISELQERLYDGMSEKEIKQEIWGVDDDES